MPPTSTRRSRREVLRMGAGAVAAALIAACTGDSGDSPATPTLDTRSVPLLGSYPGEDGAAGGVLRLGLVSDERRGETLRSLVYSQLVAVDPRTALVYADLAESVELPGSLTVVIKLRPEVRFHADAEGMAAALTAEDVRRDFQERANIGDYLFTDVVERVDAPDQRTVTLHLRGRFSQLFEFLADPATAAVRSVQRSTITREPLGSGPFVPATRGRGGDVLARNQLYHRAGLPLLEGIALIVVEDEEALADAFANGELDVYVGRNGVVDLAAARADAVELQRPTFTMMGLGLSLLPEKGGRPVRWVEAFQDARVRRAVSLALDRATLLDEFPVVPSGPVGPAHAADALPAAELLTHPLYQHDPDDARALLDAAGWPELEFRLQAPTRPRARALAQLLEEQLTVAGFAPRLQLVDHEDWQSDFLAGNFEATVFELDGLRTPDMGLRLHTSAGIGDTFSLWGYSNPVYDAAVRDVLEELDPALRASRSRYAQRLLLDDAPAMLPIGAFVEHASIGTQVRGYHYDAYGFNQSWLAGQWSFSGGGPG